jgi:hypothetical protein
VVRGDVHELKLSGGRGRGQHGRRFAVIVQADDLLALFDHRRLSYLYLNATSKLPSRGDDP